MTTTTRITILDALAAFAAQRPGLEFGNYGDVSAYRSEAASITRDLHHARAMLAAIRWRDSIDADALLAPLKSGRLTWDAENQRLDYCTGQYWPTEYRRAVCAALSSVLFDYWRENAAASPASDKNARPGDYARRRASEELGAGIARRWFR